MKSKHHNIAICFTVLSLIFCSSGYAQFYTSEKAIVHLEDNLYLKTEVNTINASISGAAALVFNAGSTQYLSSTSGTWHLPNITVDKTRLHIKASFTIIGNITLTSSFLHLNTPVILKGQLLLDDKSRIEGKAFIIQDTEVYTNHFLLLGKKSFKIASSFIKKQPLKEAKICPDANYLNTSLGYVEVLLQNNYIAVPLPPPKPRT